MDKAIPSQLYYIGNNDSLINNSKTIKIFGQFGYNNIMNNYPEYKHINPLCKNDITVFIANMLQEAYYHKIHPILFINAHGNLYNQLIFDNIKIKYNDIVSHLNQFSHITKCSILLESCFSGRFPLCCEGLVTSADSKHVSKGLLLLDALDETLQNNIFDLNDIYNNAYDDETIPFDQKSKTTKIWDAWDLTELNKEEANNLGLDMKYIDSFKPDKKGNTSLKLTPTIPQEELIKIIELLKTKKKAQKLSISDIYEEFKLINKEYSDLQITTAMNIWQYNRQQNANLLVKEQLKNTLNIWKINKQKERPTILTYYYNQQKDAKNATIIRNQQQ